MKFIHPTPILAEQMVESAQKYIADNTLLNFSVVQILQNFESWFAGINQAQTLTGFFCIRHPHEGFAEIGSVRSLVKGGLAEIIQEFEAQRRNEGSPLGCAITKGSPQKFAQLTQGKVLRTFPPWYDKVRSDKHFVQWE